MRETCKCGAAFVSETQEEAKKMLMEHGLEVHVSPHVADLYIDKKLFQAIADGILDESKRQEAFDQIPLRIAELSSIIEKASDV